MAFDLVRSEAAEVETRMDRLAVRIADARRELAPNDVPTDRLGEAERPLAQAREKFRQVVQATTLKRAELLLVDARQTLWRARRAGAVATKPRSEPRGASRPGWPHRVPQ